MNNPLDDHLSQEFQQLVQRLTDLERDRFLQELRRLLALQQMRRRLPEQGGTH